MNADQEVPGVDARKGKTWRSDEGGADRGILARGAKWVSGAAGSDDEVKASGI